MNPVRIPENRFDLTLKSGDRVLETGGGHNPHPAAHVVVDKYIDDTSHRTDALRTLPNQVFYKADGCHLPFARHEYDYSIHCHVLEHVDDPAAFLEEQFRVARRGYVELPSLTGEYLVPKNAHRWVALWWNETLYLMEKSRIFNAPGGLDFGDVFLYHLGAGNISFKLLQRTCPDLFTVRLEWNGRFRYVINPTDPDIIRLFKGRWTAEETRRLIPVRPTGSELLETLRHAGVLAAGLVRNRLFRRQKSDLSARIGLQYQNA